MKKKLKDAFKHEMQLAKNMFDARDDVQCYFHLERAHILGQRNYLCHVFSHYWMFKVGLSQRDYREVSGQVIRMIMSIFSLINLVPLGNTGRARISPIKPMPIPADLRQYFEF
jgi:hypothetical protein